MPLLLCLSAALATLPADDGHAVVRLISRGLGEAPCPTERTLLQRVASRLGYDPFDDAAAVELRVTLKRDATGAYLASLERREADAVVGRRSVGPSRDCPALVGALELALALAIDPLSGAAIGPQPAPPIQQPAIEPPTVAPQPVATAWRWTLGVAGGAVIAALPTVRPALALELATDNEALQLAAELQATVPGAVSLSEGAVWATSVSIALMPCLRWRALSVCGRATGGVMHFEAVGVPAATRAAVPSFTVGARLAAEMPIHWRLSVRVFADLAFAMNRTTVSVGTTEVWVSPLVQGQLAAAAVLTL